MITLHLTDWPLFFFLTLLEINRKPRPLLDYSNGKNRTRGSRLLVLWQQKVEIKRRDVLEEPIEVTRSIGGCSLVQKKVLKFYFLMINLKIHESIPSSVDLHWRGDVAV